MIIFVIILIVFENQVQMITKFILYKKLNFIEGSPITCIHFYNKLHNDVIIKFIYLRRLKKFSGLLSWYTSHLLSLSIYLF
jgi:hypothetical protein